MHHSMSEDSPVFAEDMDVEVRYPRIREEERGNRANWPWLPGTIVEQVGEDEWQVVIEAPELAEEDDGGIWFPVVFRDSSEIKLRSAR